MLLCLIARSDCATHLGVSLAWWWSDTTASGSAGRTMQKQRGSEKLSTRATTLNQGGVWTPHRCDEFKALSTLSFSFSSFKARAYCGEIAWDSGREEVFEWWWAFDWWFTGRRWWAIHLCASPSPPWQREWPVTCQMAPRERAAAAGGNLTKAPESWRHGRSYVAASGLPLPPCSISSHIFVYQYIVSFLHIFLTWLDKIPKGRNLMRHQHWGSRKRWSRFIHPSIF